MAAGRLHITDKSLTGWGGSIDTAVEDGLQASVQRVETRARVPALQLGQQGAFRGARPTLPLGMACPLDRLGCCWRGCAVGAAAAAAPKPSCGHPQPVGSSPAHPPVHATHPPHAGGGRRAGPGPGGRPAACAPVRVAGPGHRCVTQLPALPAPVRPAAPWSRVPCDGALCAAVHTAGGGCWRRAPDGQAAWGWGRWATVGARLSSTHLHRMLAAAGRPWDLTLRLSAPHTLRVHCPPVSAASVFGTWQRRLAGRGRGRRAAPAARAAAAAVQVQL